MEDWLGTTTYERDILGRIKKVKDYNNNTIYYQWGLLDRTGGCIVMGLLLQAMGEKVNFELSDYEITGYDFEYNVSDSQWAKGWNDERLLRITGNISRIIEKNRPALDMIRDWADREYEDDSYYNWIKVAYTYQEEIIREIIFPNAFIKEYKETIDTHKGHGTFEMLLSQKADRKAEIVIEPFHEEIQKAMMTYELFQGDVENRYAAMVASTNNVMPPITNTSKIYPVILEEIMRKNGYEIKRTKKGVWDILQNNKVIRTYEDVYELTISNTDIKEKAIIDSAILKKDFKWSDSQARHQPSDRFTAHDLAALAGAFYYISSPKTSNKYVINVTSRTSNQLHYFNEISSQQVNAYELNGYSVFRRKEGNSLTPFVVLKDAYSEAPKAKSIVKSEGSGSSLFKTLVDRYQGCYTNFTVDGTVSPPGQTISLQLPYFISGNGIYGGKSSYKSIQDAIRNKYFDPAKNNWIRTAAQIESDIHAAPASEKKNYGIDCSGFVYFVLNESTKLNENDDMKTGALYAQFQSTYANGVSAASLTSTANGTQILKAEDIVVGCTMRSDGGGHVLVVYKVDKDLNGIVKTIHYAHSNGSKGPHTASIKIGDQSKDLGDSSQTWNDIAYTDASAKKLYDHTILLKNLEPYK